MILKRVIYELYEIDLASLNDQPEWHEIDRELCLEFESGKALYFSWCNEPEQYSVGLLNHRFNENEPDHILDASKSDMWSKLIGQEITPIFLDDSHQVLELKGKTYSVYLSSQENGSWFSDVLRISMKLPKFGS